MRVVLLVVLSLLIVPVAAAGTGAAPAADVQPGSAGDGSLAERLPVFEDQLVETAGNDEQAGGVAPNIGGRIGDGFPRQLAVDGEAATINRVHFLTLDSPSEEAIVEQRVDVSSAVAIGRDEASATLDRYATAEALAQTDGEPSVIDAALSEIETDIATHRAELRADRRAFANGSIGAPEFAEVLAHHQAEARSLDRRLSALEGRIRDLDLDRRERYARLKYRLLGASGPVRGDSLAALRGTTSPVHLYLAGSPNGSVAATIGETEYVREAFREDLRSDRPPDFDIEFLFDRLPPALYPVWFNENETLSRVALPWITGTNPRVSIGNEMTFGSIVTFLDNGTGGAFYETQRRFLDTVGQPKIVTETENGTRLLINRSHRGGPLRIATIDNGTGDPVASSIRLQHPGGDRTLETGEDGIVWTLTPPTLEFTVVAVTDSGTVTTMARPLPTPAVNTS